MIILLPHTRRIGYRAKRKPSWKALREFVNEDLRIFVLARKSLKEKTQ